jgi:hypothetical protein
LLACHVRPAEGYFLAFRHPCRAFGQKMKKNLWYKSPIMGYVIDKKGISKLKNVHKRKKKGSKHFTFHTLKGSQKK